MNLTSLEVIIHVSKFNELGVQDIVEHNRAIFEPDSEAVPKALEWLRNNHGTAIHSYDPINDQENAELQLEFQDESSADEVFNEQPLPNPVIWAIYGPSMEMVWHKLWPIYG